MDRLLQSISVAHAAETEISEFKEKCAGPETSFVSQCKNMLEYFEQVLDQNGGKPLATPRGDAFVYFREARKRMIVIDTRLVDAVRRINAESVSAAATELLSASASGTITLRDAVRKCLETQLTDVCCPVSRSVAVSAKKPSGNVEPRVVPAEVAKKLDEYVKTMKSLKAVRKHKRTALAAFAAQTGESAAQISQILTTALTQQQLQQQQKSQSAPTTVGVMPSTVSLVPAPASARRMSVVTTPTNTPTNSTTGSAANSQVELPEGVPELPPTLAAGAKRLAAATSEEKLSKTDKKTQTTTVVSVPGLSEPVDVVLRATRKRRSAGVSVKVPQFMQELQDTDLEIVPAVRIVAPQDVPGMLQKIWTAGLQDQFEQALLQANTRIKLSNTVDDDDTDNSQQQQPKIVFRKSLQ